MVTEKDVTFFAQKSKQILAEISKDLVGQREVVEETVIAMIAGGNVLLEGDLRFEKKDVAQVRLHVTF